MMEATDEREDRVVVRGLRPADLDAVIALDAKNVGRRREQFFRLKLEQNLSETGIKVSLAAELDACFVGFLLARVYYGEFGSLEPVAVLDTIDVHPDFRGHGVGSALMRQLRVNLVALGVSQLRTEVGWDSQQLMRFLHREGFRPAARVCLDLPLEWERVGRRC
ncbi:MAG TPA: GNAT family N-acetyltransferase [Candidatus Polarisedimenticolaceae bacterium]|nr:GNAT family N-acetyltransferase [Candidatus Polarisedimenticolaceae bacterium]